MKLAQPFFRLPVEFDVARLREDLAAMPESAWARHPNDIHGNMSIRLISVDGGENDDVDGAMQPTQHLARAPYFRQVLESLGVVWSRSRLLRLAPRAGVPEHADINYHWFNRARLHIPIITHPDVRFHCGADDVHMRAGEAWLFDNWRLHRVENPVDSHRVHLVADTAGNAAFWQMIGLTASLTPQRVRYDPSREGRPLTEQTPLRPVMHPGELDMLLFDLQSELVSPNDDPVAMAQYRGTLDALRRDWRQLYQLAGENPAAFGEYEKLRSVVRDISSELGMKLVMRTNRIAAHQVLEGRVLRPMLKTPAPVSAAPTPAPLRQRPRHVQRPVFIVAAPRSGSTLLFETLAAAAQVYTLGGEAQWLVEGLPELRAGAPGVESNRLTAANFTPAVGERITADILAHLQDRQGHPPREKPARFVEKTPKNSLRIPFFDAVFPDARFVFLWRDPRENLSSIMEAWRSGHWTTYAGLDGFDGPWSLLLPPGWRSLNGRPLEEIAAFQWESANRLILEDLALLPRERWVSVSYADFNASPAAAVQRLCEFAEIEFDASLAARVAAPLPFSRFTQTPPSKDKWRRNEAAIVRVLPLIEATWQRLRVLD